MEMFSATPPPKRKTDHRVLKTEFVTVINLQLPKHRACIVLRQDGAIADRDIFRADEVKAVVIPVDAVVDVEAIHTDMLALNHANAMVRTINEGNVTHGKPIANDRRAGDRGAGCLPARLGAEFRERWSETARPGRQSFLGLRWSRWLR